MLECCRARVALTIVAALLLAGPQSGAIAQAPSAADGLREGVKVHGHWAIDIRQPDGMLVTHREFENALTPAGMNTLANLLSRETTVGYWSLMAEDLASFKGPCGTGAGACQFNEPNDPNLAGMPGNLQVTRYPPATGNLVLTGSRTASRAGDISVVTTLLGACLPNTPLTTLCTANGFSAARLSPPVKVAAGQLIQITVTLSFA